MVTEIWWLRVWAVLGCGLVVSFQVRLPQYHAIPSSNKLIRRHRGSGFSRDANGCPSALPVLSRIIDGLRRAPCFLVFFLHWPGRLVLCLRAGESLPAALVLSESDGWGLNSASHRSVSRETTWNVGFIFFSFPLCHKEIGQF